MADRNQIGRKTIDFFNTYIQERGVRNADLAPAGDGRLYQGGSTKGIPEDIGYEVGKGSPIDRFGHRRGSRAPIRFKR